MGLIQQIVTRKNPCFYCRHDTKKQHFFMVPMQYSKISHAEKRSRGARWKISYNAINRLRRFWKAISEIADPKYHDISELQSINSFRYPLHHGAGKPASRLPAAPGCCTEAMEGGLFAYPALHPALHAVGRASMIGARDSEAGAGPGRGVGRGNRGSFRGDKPGAMRAR